VFGDFIKSIDNLQQEGTFFLAMAQKSHFQSISIGWET
jgi:hypothetical protein